MVVDPDSDFLTDFLADEPDRPVVMLKSAPVRRRRPGAVPAVREAFGRTIAPRYGIEVVYAGNGGAALVADPGQQWDAALLVRYPNRHAFAQMVGDPDYQRIAHLRVEALSATVLQPTHPW